jgi:hypothetical protein
VRSAEKVVAIGLVNSAAGGAARRVLPQSSTQSLVQRHEVLQARDPHGLQLLLGAITTKASGARPLLAANLMKARFVFAERMGNIDGIWIAACPCEIKMEASSNGIARRRWTPPESSMIYL